MRLPRNPSMPYAGLLSLIPTFSRTTQERCFPHPRPSPGGRGESCGARALIDGEGVFIPRPAGEGIRVREGFPAFEVSKSLGACVMHSLFGNSVLEIVIGKMAGSRLALFIEAHRVARQDANPPQAFSSRRAKPIQFAHIAFVPSGDLQTADLPAVDPPELDFPALAVTRLHERKSEAHRIVD